MRISSTNEPGETTESDNDHAPCVSDFGAAQVAAVSKSVVQSLRASLAPFKLATDMRPLLQGMRLSVMPSVKHLVDFRGVTRKLPEAFRVSSGVQAQVAAMNRSVVESLAGFGGDQLLAGFQATVAPIMEAVKEGREIEESDFPFRWAESLPVPAFLRMYRRWRDDGPIAMYEVLTVELIDEETADEVTRECEECTAVACQASIIGDALWAHQQGRYSLAVPVLMAQTEGMLRRTAVQMGVIETVKGNCDYWKIHRVLEEMKRKVKRVQDRADNDKTSDRTGRLEPPLAGPFLTFLKDTYFRKKRNPVMHGNTIDYGTVELSAECILALYEALNCARNVQQWLDRLDEPETA